MANTNYQNLPAGLPVGAGLPNIQGVLMFPKLSKKWRAVLRSANVMQHISNTDPEQIAKYQGDTVMIPICPQVRSRRVDAGAPNVFATPQAGTQAVVVDRLRYGCEIATYDAQNWQQQIPSQDKMITNGALNTNEDIESEIFGEILTGKDINGNIVKNSGGLPLMSPDNMGVNAGAIHHAVNLGTATAPRLVYTQGTETYPEGSSMINQVLDLTGAVLDEANVSREGRWAVCDAIPVSQLRYAMRKANEVGSSESLLRGKAIGKISDYMLHQSNRLPTIPAAEIDGVSYPVFPIWFGQTDAWCYHMQATDIETFRMQSAPGWANRSQILYGYDPILKEAMGVLYVALVGLAGPSAP